jgi:hypothetical protein
MSRSSQPSKCAPRAPARQHPRQEADWAAMIASDPRLQTLAAGIRIADHDGRLDVAGTADRLEVPLRHAELGEYVEAVLLNGVVVLNRSSPSPGRRRFAFAHEVGHVLMSRGQMQWVDRRSEELWADWFAHELTFPRRWLREGWWKQLRLFADPAERQTIASHLASFSPQGDAVLRVDDAVVCGRCGNRQLLDGCDCRRFRDGELRLDSLPSLINANQLALDVDPLVDADETPFDAVWRQAVARVRHPGNGTLPEPALSF